MDLLRGGLIIRRDAINKKAFRKKLTEENKKFGRFSPLKRGEGALGSWQVSFVF